MPLERTSRTAFFSSSPINGLAIWIIFNLPRVQGLKTCGELLYPCRDSNCEAPGRNVPCHDRARSHKCPLTHLDTWEDGCVCADARALPQNRAGEVLFYPQ